MDNNNEQHEPEPGTLAFTARMMAQSMPDDEDPDFWDRWKDEMKDEQMREEGLL